MARILGTYHCCGTNYSHSKEVKVSPSLLDGPGRICAGLCSPVSGCAHHAGRQSAPFPSRTYGTQARPAWMNVSRTPGLYTLMYGKVRPGYLPAAQARTNEMLRGSIRSSMPGCSTIALGGDRAASAGHDIGDAGDRHQAGYPIAIDVMTSAFHRVSDFADTVDPPTGHNAACTASVRRRRPARRRRHVREPWPCSRWTGRC